MCCPWLCSHGGWLLLKCSAIGIGFNGAETNCGIAHILGILLMNSYDTYFLATAIIFRLFTLNIYVKLRKQTDPTKNRIGKLSCFKVACTFSRFPEKKILAPGVSAFHMLLQSFQKLYRNFPKTCWKAAQKPMKSCFLYRKLLKSCSKKQTLFWSDSKICKLYNKS